MIAPLKHGILQAEVQHASDKSIISSLRQRMPLRASSPLYLSDNGAVFFYIMYSSLAPCSTIKVVNCLERILCGERKTLVAP